MKKHIKYKAWLGTKYMGDKTTKKGYTVREAMEHLERNGFKPMFENKRNNKLQYVWINEAETIHAYIL